MMKSLTMTAILLFGFLAIACANSFAAEAAKPNILLIVSDDHGYADVGFNGCKDIPTPHLDSLAKSGLRCTSGYVTHPFCSPTRAGLMTGRYQQRFGHENNPFYDPADKREGLPLSERLLPDVLREAGYATGWIGKWHLGATPEHNPLARGFLEGFGFIGGGHRYQNWVVKPGVEYQVPIERDGKAIEEKEHLTIAFGREAAAFIRRHPDKPWFLYLAFNAPHTPHEPTPERLERFAAISDPKRRAYAAQVSLMDDSVGLALTALRETRQTERTLVFFFSDNGGPINVNGSQNTPFRGAKGDVLEGGVHVPFLVSWPSRLSAGKTYDKPVSSVDVFATAVSAAGGKMPTDRKYDSVNLMPFLSGESSAPPHERLFWRSVKKMAVREGSLKLVRIEGQSDALYDLAADAGEANDLAAARPDDARRLGAALDAWDKELIPPAFPGLGARRAAAGKQANPKKETEKKP